MLGIILLYYGGLFCIGLVSVWVDRRLGAMCFLGFCVAATLLGSLFFGSIIGNGDASWGILGIGLVVSLCGAIALFLPTWLIGKTGFLVLHALGAAFGALLAMLATFYLMLGFSYAGA